MLPHELRFECLRLAIETNAADPVETARGFTAFVLDSAARDLPDGGDDWRGGSAGVARIIADMAADEPWPLDETDWHVLAQDISNYWQHPDERAIAYQAAGEAIKILRAAQGTEAGTAETEGLGPKDDGPVLEEDAPK